MRPRNVAVIICCLLSGLAVSAQSKKKQTPATCAGCHQTESLAQPGTQMGQAMQLPPVNSVLNTHPSLSSHTGGFSYSVETHNGKSVYTVTDGTKSVSLPILWSMGAQAQTWVLERNGQLYESAVSYYPVINGLDFTTGDEHLNPKTVDEAVGRPISNDEAVTCFNCHATHAVMDHKLTLASLRPGVGCERCHVEAGAHLSAILANSDSVPIPEHLGKMSAEDNSNFCGQCHRTWETAIRGHWHGPADVRFQPFRLANSRCFNGTDARIRCLACHNPHEKVVRDESYYDGKCLACHAPVSATVAATTPPAKICPVATSKCVSCHMPKVPLPNGHLQFTDHEIRIVRPNEPYPN